MLGQHSERHPQLQGYLGDEVQIKGNSMETDVSLSSEFRWESAAANLAAGLVFLFATSHAVKVCAMFFLHGTFNYSIGPLASTEAVIWCALAVLLVWQLAQGKARNILVPAVAFGGIVILPLGIVQIAEGTHFGAATMLLLAGALVVLGYSAVQVFVGRGDRGPLRACLTKL